MCLALSVAIGVLLIPSFARADTIIVEHNGGRNPSEVTIMLQTEIEASQLATAFVGVTIKAGATATCAANYAQDLESPASYEVMTNEEVDGKIKPDEDSGVGPNATVPGGPWSLCGWVQPEGNTSTAVPSATYGPARFTVGGLTGTSSITAPTTVLTGDAVIANVQYSAQEMLGEIHGLMTASLYVTAYSGSDGCASPSGTAQHSLINTETQQGSVGITGNQSGSAQFGAMLPPGVYSLCAEMQQSLLSDNTPGIRPQTFATSAVTTTVLGLPSPPPSTPSALVSPHATVPKPHGCTTVRDNGLSAALNERESSCEIAHGVVVKLLRKVGRPDEGDIRRKTIVRVPANGGDFVCHIQGITASRYTATCDRGHAVIVAKVILNETKERRK